MRPRDLALALLVILIWGVNFVVIKLSLRGVSPFVLGGLRFFFAAFPAIFFVPRPKVPFRFFLSFGLITFLAQFAMLFWAIKVGMPTGLSSVVAQSQAFFTVLLAAAVLGEIPNRSQIAGVVIAAVALTWLGSQSGASFPFLGFALNLCAAAFWALGNLVSRSLRRYAPVNGIAFVVWSSLVPIVPFFALALAFEGPTAVAASLGAMKLGSWVAVGYLAFAATLGGYGLWNHLLKAYPAAQVAPFSLLVPVVGLLCGAFVLDEHLAASQLTACALVATGLAVPMAAAWWERRAEVLPGTS